MKYLPTKGELIKQLIIAGFIAGVFYGVKKVRENTSKNNNNK